MSEILEEKKPKTPIYIRNASNRYYNKIKNDPVKYAEYCEKKRNYQRSYYAKKKKEQKEKKLKLIQEQTEQKDSTEKEGVIVVL